MKIKTMKLSYDEVMALPKAERKKPIRPNPLLSALVRTLSKGDLKKVNFSYEAYGMDRLKRGESALFLMNHSSFIDLEIASVLLKDHPYQIVCTSDGFVGKEGLMRSIGCIPTQKFVSDINLIRDMQYSVKELGTSILMYPEASYSFDGTETPLPDSLAKCIKLLNVPVVIIRTHGAFLMDPLYNMLQKRKRDVSAEIKYVLSKEDIKSSSVDEINDILTEHFSYDHFREQQEKSIKIDEPFRADGLNRVLYKCSSCGSEGQMNAGGIAISCGACNRSWKLSEYGKLIADGEIDSDFSHIPDWYRWQREEVKKEITAGTYSLDIPVEIYMMVDRRAVYHVGDGQLTHSVDGFRLEGANGKIAYSQSPMASYSLYADYFWYEIGDMICIGDMKTSYYCFPKNNVDVAAKTRLATEELYKLKKAQRAQRKKTL